MFPSTNSSEVPSGTSENVRSCPMINREKGQNLTLMSGSCYFPHPDKESTGGEDAHFICSDEQILGVADGLGGSKKHGIDSGIYARALMMNSIDAVQEEPNKDCIEPSRVLAKAYRRTKDKGSSTACIIALRDQVLKAINVGDSGFMVIRNGCVIFRSPIQQHRFNHPYKLKHGSGDSPSLGQAFNVPVASGDAVIVGTDGLFDNLTERRITKIVVHAISEGLLPEEIAETLATLAQIRSRNRDKESPFSVASQAAGRHHRGGKVDDITVIASYVF